LFARHTSLAVTPLEANIRLALLTRSTVEQSRDSHAVVVGVIRPDARGLLEADHDLENVGHGCLEPAPRVKDPGAVNQGCHLLVVGLVVVGSARASSVLEERKSES
jgi:hypothetical protein